MTTKTAQRIIVDTCVQQLCDDQRYVDNTMVRERCIRAYEVQCGFKFNGFARRMAEQSINSNLHALWQSKGFIPSHKADVEPIKGVPQFLAVKQEIGWTRTRWDWTRPEDWDLQLETMVNNAHAANWALDEFQAVYDYVHPMLLKTKKPLGKIIQIEFDF